MMLVNMLIIAGVLLLLFLLLIIVACVINAGRISREEEKYQQMISQKWETINKGNNPYDIAKDSPLFCLAMNKPVRELDFKKMRGCSPSKCAYCNLSVFRDL